MARTKISEFSSTPGNNTDIDSINIAENCPPSGINDAIRELMAQLKDFQAGTAGDSFNGPVGTTTAAAGAFTTLSASGAVTLSGGTANGMAYLNGSKVLTTGSALTFDGTRLRTVGYLYVNSDTDYLRMIDAADSTYIARITKNGSNIELWNRTGGGLIFGANDSEGMRLTSTGLGIGTSSPTAKLDVRGNATFTGNGTSRQTADFTNTGGQLYVGAESSSGGAVFVGSSAYAGIVGTNTNTPLQLGTNGTIKATLDSSGNLGLGVTPSAWSSTYKAFQFGPTGAVASDSGASYLAYNWRTDGSNNRYITTSTAGLAGWEGNSFKWYQAPSGTAGNAISFTQAMTLTAAGELLINRTSASGLGKLNVEGGADFTNGNVYMCRDSGNLLVGKTSGNCRLDVEAAFTGSQAVARFGNTTASGAVGCVDTSLESNGNSTSSYHLRSVTQSVNIWYLYGNGTSSFTSDQRLKKNIATARDGYLDDLMQLRVVKYHWKNNDDASPKELGLIAQEVEQVFPGLVQEADVEFDGVTPKVLKGSVLPFMLLKAIQEQQAIIEDMKTRLAAAGI